jgi:alkylation response protein AidB-like acyl-CoA dehydrogenase
VDLDFNEEQVMLRDTARGICEELSPSAVVRAMEQDEAGYSAPFWRQLSELGITSLGIPEAHGGMAWGASGNGDCVRGVWSCTRTVTALGELRVVCKIVGTGRY